MKTAKSPPLDLTQDTRQAVPLLVLGDPAYPLLPWLLKAFIDHGSLTAEQKLFNYRLSKARVMSLEEK